MKKSDFDAIFASARSETLKEYSPEKIKERLSKYENSNGKISMENLSAELFFMNMDYSDKLIYSVLSKMLDIEE